MRVKFERQPLSDGPYKRSYSDYRPAYEMKNKFTGRAKIRQETPQVKNLWKRLRNWKGNKSMAFGDDPYGKNYALCAVAGNMVNLKMEVRDVLRRAGCSGFFVFSHLLTFSLSHFLTFKLPLRIFRLQNPESLICVLGNNIINNQKKNNYGNQEHFEDFNRGL